jgi:hypothetical protein
MTCNGSNFKWTTFLEYLLGSAMNPWVKDIFKQ